MSAPIFTTAEFVRMQQQVATLQEKVKELNSQLFYWKPQIEIAAAPELDGVKFTCKFDKDGFTHVISTHELAEAPAEILNEYLHELAVKSSNLKIKSLENMIRPSLQKAADYAKVVLKGN